MTEYVLQITEEQQKKLLEMMNLVQVRLSEAESFLDLKRRIELSKEKQA